MKNQVFLIKMLFVASLLSSMRIQQGQTGPRHYESINSHWIFAIDSMAEGEKNRWHVYGVPKHQAVTVPHTWNTDTLYHDYHGLAWYEKTLYIPKNREGKSIRLSFERVYHSAKIWINGQLVHERTGAGYTGFIIEISQYIDPGKQNKIVVCVDNSPSPLSIPYMNSFDWAMDGGIIGEVQLIISDRPRVENVFVHSSYKREENTISGNLTLQVILEKEDTEIHDASAFYIAITQENQPTSDTVHKAIATARKDKKGFWIDISLADINLWHFDTPNLYHIVIEPIIDGRATDRFTTTMGFRKFEVKDGSIFLNDEEVRLTGVEWMPGSSPEHGFAEPEDYIRKVLSDMKDLNSVFTRFHWQQSPRVIDLCNRLGILVQEEIPLWQQPEDFSLPQLSDLAKKHADEMVSRHFNSPAIIAWGIGNELASLNDKTIESLLMLKEYLEKLDSTRVISYVSNHIGENPEKEVSQYFDWIMMNDYYGTWFPGGNQAIGPVLDQIHHLYPDKPVIIAEWGLCEECNPDYDQGGGDERRIRDMMEHYEQYITRPWVKGFIYFSYNDYRTHMGIHGTGRHRQRIHGVVDLHLTPKPSWQHLKQISSPLEFIEKTQTNTTLTITLRNKSNLPSYTVKNYTIEVARIGSDQTLINQQLETLLPGNLANIEIPDIKAGRYKLSVFRPTGSHVIDHEFTISY